MPVWNEKKLFLGAAWLPESECPVLRSYFHLISLYIPERQKAYYGKNGPEFGKNGPQLSLIFSKVSFKIDFMGLEGPDHKAGGILTCRNAF